MEGYTRGLLHGSHNILERVVELSKKNLLKQEEETNGIENTFERPDGGSGHY
jgi:hypothetical protein